MPNDPAWPADEVGRTTYRTPITVLAAVGTVNGFPASASKPYATMFGAGVTPPQNSLTVRDYAGNLLPFGVRRFDGTTCFIDWMDSFASADKTDFLYFHPTVDPGWSYANPTGVYDSATRGAWHLEEPSGALVDATGNGYHLANYGAGYDEAGRLGKAMSFNGTDQSVGVGSALGIGNYYTVEAWIKPAAVSGGNVDQLVYGYTVLASSVPANYAIWLCVKNAELNAWAFAISVNENHTTSGAGLVVGQWYHVAMSAVRGGATIVYVNGVPLLSYTNSGAVAMPAAWRIGDLRQARNIGFSGVIDETAAHNVIRGSEWPNARTLFGLGTAVTVGAVETYEAGGVGLHLPKRYGVEGLVSGGSGLTPKRYGLQGVA